MAKHLPDPAGDPHPAARRIIDAITDYLDSGGDPLTVTRSLRHVYHHAERAWDASVAAARTDGASWASMAEATGDAVGTLQGRARAHQIRTGGGTPARKVGDTPRGGGRYVRLADRDEAAG